MKNITVVGDQPHLHPIGLIRSFSSKSKRAEGEEAEADDSFEILTISKSATFLSIP